MTAPGYGRAIVRSASRSRGFRPSHASFAALSAALFVLVAAPGSAHATFPGANGRIAFENQGGNDGFPTDPDGFPLLLDTVALVNPDGSGLAQLPREQSFEPAWSPDGSRIAFSAGDATSDRYDIFVMNADGSDPVDLAVLSGNQLYPAWSPDGRKIAFTTDFTGDGPAGIYVMNADGSDPAFVADGARPSWSPDGTKIAFDADNLTTGNADVYVMDADGSHRVDLTPTSDHSLAIEPDWSPDGTKIAFVQRPIAQAFNFLFVYVMNADGSGQTQLTHVPADFPQGFPRDDRHPSWSPDGTKIAYEGEDSLTQDIWSMNADGSGATDVTPQVGHCCHDFFRPSWGPAATPIIFVPGFLASKLRCSSGELWPNLPLPRLGAMDLQADGVTDAGGGGCTGPVTTDGVVETALGSDIHGSTLQFLNRVTGGNDYVYAWDWRKSPEQALAGLDQLVDKAQAANGGRKVAILAHSFGGLLTRLYIDDPTRAAKVKRALFVGTPSWGSPKAFFPLATGTETPAEPYGLSLFLEPDALKGLARNLAGAYFLYPSDHYGTWLTVNGRIPSVLDSDAKLVDYVNDDLLGNGDLLQHALDTHADVLDGWKTNGVDVRAIVGTGMNTVTAVDLMPGTTADDDQAELSFGNGDETVPARSATQGTPGTNDPLGENIPIRYACNISHVPLASDTALTDAGAAGFLLNGAELTVPDQPCDNGGFSVELFDVNLDPTGGFSSRLAAGGADSILTAENAGDIDVIRFPGADYIVTNDRRPVHLTIPDPGAHVIVHRLDGEAAGPAQTFSAQPGGLVLDTTAGKSISVTPLPVPPTLPVTPPVGGDQPGGGQPVSTAQPQPGIGSPTPTPTPTPTPAKVKAKDHTPPRVTISIRRSHGHFLVTLRATDKGGVKRIQYRLTHTGAFHTYHRTLRLTTKQLKALRVRATDKAGNTSKPLAAKLPHG